MTASYLYRRAIRRLIHNLRLINFLQRYIRRNTGVMGDNSEGYRRAWSWTWKGLVSTDRNATVQRYKERVRVSDKAVSIYMWVGHREVDLSQFPENRRSLQVKNSETLKNWEGVLSYGHVYQFSFYIITILTADPICLWTTHGKYRNHQEWGHSYGRWNKRETHCAVGIKGYLLVNKLVSIVTLTIFTRILSFI